MKRRMVLLFLVSVVLATTGCYATEKYASISCDTDLSDALGHMGTNSTASISAGGYVGNYCRSSHNGDDGVAKDFHKFGSVPPGDIWAGMYLMYDPSYVNRTNNVKWVWIEGETSGHFELIYQKDTVPNVLSLRMQLTVGGAGFRGGGTPVLNFGTVPYTKGQWMGVICYIKKSTGANHLNPDGVIQVIVNGQMVYNETEVVTGIMDGTMHLPGINAIDRTNNIVDQAPGAGWWGVDDIQLWGGVPPLEIQWEFYKII